MFSSIWPSIPHFFIYFIYAMIIFLTSLSYHSSFLTLFSLSHSNQSNVNGLELSIHYFFCFKLRVLLKCVPVTLFKDSI
jgi:hypothetical protein